MKNFVKSLATKTSWGIVWSAAFLSGCASLAGEKTQPVTVQTTLDHEEVAGVGCNLSNDAGKWFVTTPGSVVVHKSTGDLSVDCAQEAAVVGHETVVSKSNGAVWGNVIAGGGIGYVIDRNTGAGFDYPGSITVALRRVKLVAPAAAAASAPASAPADPAAPASAASAPALAASSVALVGSSGGAARP